MRDFKELDSLEDRQSVLRQFRKILRSPDGDFICFGVHSGVHSDGPYSKCFADTGQQVEGQIVGVWFLHYTPKTQVAK
ncbi:hypothetical protein EWB00_010338 [Schistosoma japonicum]|uniref:Uncharacterized protein n=1 Tax=Schistosoma japonicum TaxID=6182 RepID=A0A4Z2DP65_SCHJA|nr:hypothetical protein EWB00_010338 [Schistosoma japonicum]